jgi:3D (Asp-Asp-Asp) domain-containing protein
VKLPQTLIKVDQGAFENCTALTYMYIPTNVEIIGAWSFKGCTALEEVDMTYADATEIRAGAFKNCSALTTIMLPENIRTLGDSCFYGIGATTFTVPATVTKIEPWCFARAKVTEIIFRGDAPGIGAGAFNKIALTATYNAAQSGWTVDMMQNYGGTVTWRKDSETVERKAPFYGLDAQILKQQLYVGTAPVPGTTQWRATVEGNVITDQFEDKVRFTEKLTGSCTAYFTEGEITSKGYPCQYGIVAVDPREIPYGTRMFICSPDGSFVYGYCVAGDTGGFIYNSNTLVDLRYNSSAQCWDFFGRRNMCVYILE